MLFDVFGGTVGCRYLGQSTEGFVIGRMSSTLKGSMPYFALDIRDHPEACDNQPGLRSFRTEWDGGSYAVVEGFFLGPSMA